MERNLRRITVPVALVMALGFLLTAGSGCSSIRRVVIGGNSGSAAARVVFTSSDREQIQEWYHQNGLPPGLAKKDQLPPGHRKQLRRKGTLPPGIAKRALPDGLSSGLSRLPEGYARFLIAGDVVLIDVRTQAVVDIIEDVG